MQGNSGDKSNPVAMLGGNLLPVRQGRLVKTEAASQPGDQPVLATEQSESMHAGNMTRENIKTQEGIINHPNADPDDDEGMEDMAQTIRAARIRLKLRQTDIARAMQIQQSTISHWESGRFRPKLNELIRLAAILHLSPRDLMPEAGDITAEDLKDPQVRRLVANFLKLPPEERSAFDLLLQRAAEKTASDD